MKLSKNFSRHEFACRCGCGFDTVDAGLIHGLQAMCDYFSAYYRTEIRCDITGPNRCEKHNASEGRDEGSRHVHGRAADHKVFRLVDGEWVQIAPIEVFHYYDEHHPDCGLGLYSNRVHFDSRSNGPARWSE